MAANFPPKVLVLEDDPQTCSCLREILQLQGYDVEVAGTAGEAERLAMLEQGMAVLGHESRNALFALELGLELLAGKAVQSPEEMEIIEHLRAEVEDLKSLFSDVRCYAAPLKLKLGWCDLAAIIQDVWSELEEQRRDRQARLTVETDGDPCCEIDASRMKQVFRNLLLNSCEACTESVAVHVRISNGRDPGSEVLEIDYRDDGPGLTPDARGRLFEPFFTTREHGTGLGMTIIRRIIETHGGAIAAADTETGGAEFIIALPRTQAGPE